MPTINQVLNQIKKGIKANSQKEYFLIHVARYQYLLKIIQSLNLSLNKPVLDIGCYPPHIFQALKDLGYHPYGISSEHEIIKNKDVSICNIEHDPFPFSKSHFNFVLFSEVLEHLTADPQIIFTKIKRVLLPSGYLLVTTPNAVRSQNLIKILLGLNIYYDTTQLKENIYHRHNREYTLSELKNIVTESGLTITNSGYFISYPPFREKNLHDSFILKIIKSLNYLFMLIIPSRQDTLYIIAQNN